MSRDYFLEQFVVATLALALTTFTMKRAFTFLLCCSFSVMLLAQSDRNRMPADSLGPEVTLALTDQSILPGNLPFGVPSFWVNTLFESVSGDLAWGFDANGDSLGCEPFVNDLTGKVALIRRGVCNFSQKANYARNAGAVAFVIVSDGRPIGGMGADVDTTTVLDLPGALLANEEGDVISAAVDAGSTVEINFNVDTTNLISNMAPYNYAVIPVTQVGMPLYKNPSATYINLNGVDSVFDGTLTLVKPSGATEILATNTDTIQPNETEYLQFDRSNISLDLDEGVGNYSFIYESSLGTTSTTEVAVSEDYYQTVADDASLIGVRVTDAGYSDGAFNQFVVHPIIVDKQIAATSYGFALCNVEELIDSVRGDYPFVEVDIVDPDLDGDFMFDEPAFTDFSDFSGDNVIAFGFHDLVGDETCDGNMNSLITIPLESEVNGQNQVILEGGKVYFVRLYIDSGFSGSKVSPEIGSMSTAFAEGVIDPETDFYSFNVVDPAGGDTLAFNNRYMQIANITRGFGGWIPAMRLNVEDVVSSVNTAKLLGEVTLFPNPATQTSQLRYSLQADPTNGVVEVYSMTGQLVHTQQLLGGRSGMIDINTSELATGMYNVRVSTDAGERTLPLQVVR